MRGGGMAVGGLVGGRVVVAVIAEVEVLGAHANAVEVVLGEVTVAVFVVSCVIVKPVLPYV